MCPVFRIHSVLDELSYTKGKVDKNSRSGKGNLIAVYFLPHKTIIGNVYIFPVMDVL